MRKSPYPPGSGWDNVRNTRLEATKEKRAKLAQGQKDLRQWCKEHGICTRCHKEPAIEGQTLCPQCREYNNLSRRGKPRPPMTPEQKARQYEWTKEWRRKNREAGICYVCGKERALPGLKTCRVCRAYINESRHGYVEHSLKWWEKERKAGRLKENLCKQ